MSHRVSDGKTYHGYKIYGDGHRIVLPEAAVTAGECAQGVKHLDRGAAQILWQEAIENDLNIPFVFDLYRLVGDDDKRDGKGRVLIRT